VRKHLSRFAVGLSYMLGAGTIMMGVVGASVLLVTYPGIVVPLVILGVAYAAGWADEGPR
jgi:hypothetical protein